MGGGQSDCVCEREGFVCESVCVCERAHTGDCL